LREQQGHNRHIRLLAGLQIASQSGVRIAILAHDLVAAKNAALPL